MAHQATLQADRRDHSGKGAARSIRRAGRIPAVIYGHGRAPATLSLEATAFGRLLTGITAGSTVLEVSVAGEPPVKALIREIQRHPLRATDILHVDLYEIRADKKITLEIPVHVTGTADGVRNHGGVLDQVLHRLEIRVFPGDIPDHIEVDVTPLAIGKSIFVRDVKLAKGEILNDPSLPVCSVVAPRTEEVVAPVVAEAPLEPELIRKPKAEGEGEGEAEGKPEAKAGKKEKD
jgi:large subunit ribosomal protein L25